MRYLYKRAGHLGLLELKLLVASLGTVCGVNVAGADVL